MIRRWLLSLLISLVICAASAQDSKTPTQADLAATSARGKMLAEYDVAAWHATDAVEALQPDHAAAPLYLAHKTGGKWQVVFGRMSPRADSFLVVYRAQQGTKPDEFSVKKSDPPAEDHGFYFEAAKAFDTATKDFGKPPRPYNRYVLPSGNGQLYVYLLPAQTNAGIYPFGADVRYTITLDGGTIIAKREMHKTIIEAKPPASGQTVAAGTHSHVLNNDVEDSDVFHVLNRTPAIPEYVGTPDKHVYEIRTDGVITRIR